MKTRKLIFLAAISLSIGIGGCIVTSFMGYSMHPTLSPYYGLKLHKGLSGEATIIRDKWGVPHIQADNLEDMFFATGYAQAQDRLFQMDMFRHLVAGRLAEIVGDREFGMDFNHEPTTILKQDRLHRIIGYSYIGEAASALIKDTRPELYNLMQAYSNGVNAYVEDCGDKLPLEFKMLNYKPEPWTPKDIIILGRFVGWMLASNTDMELMRLAFAEKFGEELMWKILPVYNKAIPEIPTIIPRDVVDYRKLTPVKPTSVASAPHLPDTGGMAADIVRILDQNRAYANMIPFPYASNNWVVGPKFTASGKPILANDPHLAHMMPATFWQVHMKGAGIDAYGVAFPGMPFIVLGHNRHLAWGMTTSRADVQDIYIEKFDEKGEKYLYKNEWYPIAKRREYLKVRDGMRGKVVDAGYVDVRLTRHGPIINDMSSLYAKSAPLAMRWVAYDFTTDQNLTRLLLSSSSVDEFVAKAKEMNPQEIANEADVILACMKGEGIADFKKALRDHGVPNQNWVAVDDKGNFGYMAAGRVPIRPRGQSTVPVQGWTGEDEWLGFIPSEHIPQVFNPERGYVATANNEVVPQDDYPYVFTYSVTTGWRAMRIEQMLKEKMATKKLTAQDMAEIQNDVKMLAAQYMVPKLLEALADMKDITLQETMAKKILEKWDFFATTDSVGASIFNEWHFLIADLMLKDDLGEDYLKLFTSNSLNMVQIEGWILNDSPLFDDKNTPQTETRGDIFRLAFRQAVANLEKKLGKDMMQWQWGKLHTIEFKHPLGAGPLAKYLNFGPLPHSGGFETVRNASHRVGDFATLGGPCLRHVVDMGSVEDSLWVIDGGESGQWKSPHYNDGAAIWHRGEYIRAIMNLGELVDENDGIFKLRPLPEKK